MTLVQVLDNPDFDTILEPGETVLWTGRPEYGLRVLELLGHERMLLAASLIGICVFAITYAFLPDPSGFAPWVMPAVFGFFSVVLLYSRFLDASIRQDVISSFMYVVTDRRAIVLRYAKNFRLKDRLYVVSTRHSAQFQTYIFQTKPHPSLRIGTLLSKDSVQPFGFGLTHPGQTPFWARVTKSVYFEQVSNAEALQAMIVEHQTRAREGS